MGFTVVESQTLRADLLVDTVDNRGARSGTRRRRAFCKSKLLAKNRCVFQLTTGAAIRRRNGLGCVYLLWLSLSVPENRSVGGLRTGTDRVSR